MKSSHARMRAVERLFESLCVPIGVELSSQLQMFAVLAPQRHALVSVAAPSARSSAARRRSAVRSRAVASWLRTRL
eukprot:6179804-Pleurochrysis_carterae.AAC.2